MPYPNSPFDEVFNLRVVTNLKGPAEDKEIQIDVKETLKWLCTSPKITSYRINSLKTEKNTLLNRIQDQLDKVLGQAVIKAEFSNTLSDVILIKHVDLTATNFEKHLNEVIIDVECGAAILRGAHIYAPGILAMISGTQKGDRVSIYTDLSKKCKKGLLKVYVDEKKVFIGNGIVRMTRQDLFGEHLTPNGIAVEITETISGCPPIGNDFLPMGWAVLQNLPSVICIHVLNPQENDSVLDMCAAPGNKTTHIAALMENKGTLVAIDKTPKKLEQLKKTCLDFNAKVFIFQADSSKIVDNNQSQPYHNPKDGPPYLPETFDKILLDAPCSALGKRPQFVNKTSEKVIRSYVPLQRKLLESAIHLLKPGGSLVYSTCTITLAENEGIIAWALKNFVCLELARPELYLGGPGWFGTTLSDEERKMVQRFGPDQEFDSEISGYYRLILGVRSRSGDRKKFGRSNNKSGGLAALQLVHFQVID